MLCNAVGGGRPGYQISVKKALQRCTVHIISVTRGWVGVEFPERSVT